jgi:hypothetical protein
VRMSNPLHQPVLEAGPCEFAQQARRAPFWIDAKAPATVLTK